MVMPAPTGERHENSCEGKSRDSGFSASMRKNSTRPMRPTAISRDERSSAMSTPAEAISTTLMARQPSAAKGKGGALPSVA